MHDLKMRKCWQKHVGFNESSAFHRQACLEMQNCHQIKPKIDDCFASCVYWRKSRHVTFSAISLNARFCLFFNLFLIRNIKKHQFPAISGNAQSASEFAQNRQISTTVLHFAEIKSRICRTFFESQRRTPTVQHIERACITKCRAFVNIPHALQTVPHLECVVFINCRQFCIWNG